MLGYLYIDTNFYVAIDSMFINYIENRAEHIAAPDCVFSLSEDVDLFALRQQLNTYTNHIVHGLTIYKDLNQTEVVWQSNHDFKVLSLTEAINIGGSMHQRDLTFDICSSN